VIPPGSAGRSRATLSGLVVGAAPGVLAGAAMVAVNPWFHDRVMLYTFVFVLLPGLLGALGGALWERVGRFSGVPGTGWALGLLSVVHVGAVAWPTPMLSSVDVLVLGVDGATFDVIDELDLPAFERLAAEGSRAVLGSMEPTFSPLLWTTMASGKPPEVHGVQGFHVHATDCRVPRFWDVAESEGRSTGIYKWLVTYPPRAIDGFIVPAWLAQGPETYPEDLSFVKELELANRLKRQKVDQVRTTKELVLAGLTRGFRFGTLWEAASWTLAERTRRPDDDERHYRLQILRGWIDRDVFFYATHTYQPELATFTWYATDALGHRFWRQHEPEAFSDVSTEELERFGSAVTDAYRGADAVLAELLESLPAESTLFLVSDHGFQALSAASEKAFFAPLTERLRSRLTAMVGPVDVSRLGIKLAVAATDDAVDMAALGEAIDSLRDETGQPAFVWEHVPEAPRSLGLTLRDEQIDAARMARGTIGGEPLSDYVKLTEAFSGEHTLDGVIYARGPGIPAGVEHDRAHLLDVAPTVLAHLGIPPAADLAGDILWASQARGPASRDELASELEFEEGLEGVDEEALRALGYIE